MCNLHITTFYLNSITVVNDLGRVTCKLKSHWQHNYWVHFLVCPFWSYQLSIASQQHSMHSIFRKNFLSGKNGKNSIWISLCLANVLVCITGLVMMGGGVWIVLDYQDRMEIRQEMLEHVDE